MAKEISYFCKLLEKGDLGQIASGTRFAVEKVAGTDTPKQPIFATLRVTDNCNLNCIMCPRNDPEAAKQFGEISFKNYKKLIDAIPNLHRVTPVGLGEPLLHPEIFEILKYTKKKGIEILLITNGMLMDPKTAKKLLDIGVDHITVSLDAANQELLSEIRRGANFDLIIKNTQFLIGLRNAGKYKTKVGFGATLMKKTLAEMPKLAKLAARTGVDELIIQELQEEMSPNMSKEDSLRYQKQKEKYKQVLVETKKICDEKGLWMRIPTLKQNTKHTTCTEPWTTITINAKGNVTPCCAIYDVFFGNVYEQDFKEIWNSPQFVGWRKKMKSNNPPNQCLNCHFF